jgi:hypothetical protein
MGNPQASAKSLWDSINSQAKGAFAQTFGCSGAWETVPGATVPGCASQFTTQAATTYVSTMAAAWALVCLLLISIGLAWCLRRGVRDAVHKKELEAAAAQARAEAHAEATTQYNQKLATVMNQGTPYAGSVYGASVSGSGQGLTQAYVPQFGVNTSAEPGRRHPGYTTLTPSNAIVSAPAGQTYSAPTYGLAVAQAPTVNSQGYAAGISNVPTGAPLPATNIGTTSGVGGPIAGATVTTSGSIVPPSSIV